MYPRANQSPQSISFCFRKLEMFGKEISSIFPPRYTVSPIIIGVAKQMIQDFTATRNNSLVSSHHRKQISTSPFYCVFNLTGLGGRGGKVRELSACYAHAMNIDSWCTRNVQLWRYRSLFLKLLKTEYQWLRIYNKLVTSTWYSMVVVQSASIAGFSGNSTPLHSSGGSPKQTQSNSNAINSPINVAVHNLANSLFAASSCAGVGQTCSVGCRSCKGCSCRCRGRVGV